jgi:hypothetical protein
VIADFLEKTKDVSDVRDYVEFWREGAEVISENNKTLKLPANNCQQICVTENRPWGQPLTDC